YFLVMAGGGSPANNEIALEKNVLYFQRTLREMGFNPTTASLFFASGNRPEATVRYLDEEGRERFKVPDIPNLTGAATPENWQGWLQETLLQESHRPQFLYFTGHGVPDEFILWGNGELTVRQLAQSAAQFPQSTPVVVMMAQCFSGSFADFIYQEGDPRQPVALQSRCGFFATVRSRPSVGCTPEVDESDYKDYSSSFFAGLSGRSRIGEPVSSADYNQDGEISYREAHAFTKVDMETMDWPVSTVEVWMQEQTPRWEKREILRQPIKEWVTNARPEQQYVIRAIAKRYNFNLQQSYERNYRRVSPQKQEDEVESAFLQRLAMELVNVAKEAEIRNSGDETAIAILDRLLHCENKTWQK
ncbi:MAG: Caspase domain-containing protein, partial [Kamptonema sp. SIO4C4]|nr:Caspase domain-containing protein [Kamptonema sp. SIO4C4]